MDGAQLYHFSEHPSISPKDNYNKLWYYYGTLGKHFTSQEEIPRYFVWLLVLPDREVENCFTVWDSTPAYGFFDRSLNQVVCRNPYRFYDRLIKGEAALFLMRMHEFRSPKSTKWVKKSLTEFQTACELAFITCTGDQLILSRGSDLFDPSKELRVPLNWRSNGRQRQGGRNPVSRPRLG